MAMQSVLNFLITSIEAVDYVESVATYPSILCRRVMFYTNYECEVS
jgi:hypothetical protein